MIIAVDLDGVCYHWDRTARYMLRRWYEAKRRTPPISLGHNSTSWDMIEKTVESAAWKWLWNEGVDAGLYRHGHIVGGTIEGLTQLVGDGHKVVIATARPPKAVSDTLAWATLQLHRVPLSDIRFVENKLQVDADLYLDDGLHNIVALAEAGRDCIIFDRPWNQKALESLKPTGRGLVARAYSWIGPESPTVVGLVKSFPGTRGGIR